MNSVGSRRMISFGLVAGVGMPALMRVAGINGWFKTSNGLTAMVLGLAAMCIIGGFLAYSMSAEQVKSDRKEIGLDG